MTIPAYVWHAAWHGFSAGALSFCATIVALLSIEKRMPYDWEWIIIICTALPNLIRGVMSYRVEPH